MAPASRTHIPAIEPRRSALLVVDLQNGFVEPGWTMSIPGAGEVLPHVRTLAAAMRAAGGKVVFIRHTVTDEPSFALAAWYNRFSARDGEGAYLLAAGRPAHAINADLVVEPGDLVVDKHRYSALHPSSSHPHEMLCASGVDTLLICGLATNVCCESTARDAQMYGYRVVFVADATRTFSAEEHAAALLNIGVLFADVRTTAETLRLLSQAGPARGETNSQHQIQEASP
jgi:ureidoacrylate peracid hydrolase